MKITISVCCYNSENRISETIKSLAQIIIPSNLTLDLLIIDNNCTDNTVKLVESLWVKYLNPYTLKVIHEKNQGLSYARRCAIMNSASDYMIFCDDDNQLDKFFLVNILKIISSDKKIGVIGSKSLPIFSIDPPVWFNKYKRCYAVGDQYHHNGFIPDRNFFWGAGLTLKIDKLRVFFNNGNFNLISGRKAGRLLSGEDGEICAWMKFMRYKFYYSNELVIHHLIPSDRLTKDYLSKIIHGFRISSVWKVYDSYLNIKYNKTINLKSIVYIMLHPVFLAKIILIEHKLNKI